MTGARVLPRLLVAGEANVGKSTVINLLLRRPLLAVSVVSSEAGLVSLRPGDGDSPDRRPAAGPASVPEIRFGPGPPGSPRLEIDEVTLDAGRAPGPAQRAAIAAADLLVWCTMAQRALSRSELATLATLPDRLQGTAVLALTRWDQVDDPSRDRLLARIGRDGRHRFAAVVPLACPRPRLQALSDPAVAAAQWRASGADALDAAVRDGLRAPRRHAAPATATATTPRPRPRPGPDSPVAATPASDPARPPLQARWARRLDGLLDAAAAEAAPDPRFHALRLADALAGFLAMMPADRPAHRYLRSAYVAELARVCHAQPARALGLALPPLIDLALQLEEDLVGLDGDDGSRAERPAARAMPG